MLTRTSPRPTAASSGTTMHVAYFMSRFPKLSETFILREMLELESSGVTIDVFALVEETGTTVHSELEDLRADRHYSSPGSREVWRDQIYWLRRRPRRLMKMWWRAVAGNWRSPAFVVRSVIVAVVAATFARKVERLGIDHIHAHYATHPALAAYLVHLLTGTSYSITAHAHDIYVNRTMLEEKLEHASSVVTISDYNRRYLSNLYPGVSPNIRVIHCGIKPSDFEHLAGMRKLERAPNRYPLEILSVGSLEAYKGHRYLIEACAMMRDLGVPFRCMIAGGGEDAHKLRELIDELDLKDSVRLVGPVTQTEVRDLLAWSTIFVLPSVIDSSGKKEGIPVALMEAMAAGRLVVSTNISGIPELILPGKTGFLVDPEQAGELAATLARVRDNPNQAKQIAAQGREHVLEHFELGSTCEQLRQELVRAIDNQPEPPFRVAQVVDNLEIGGAQQLLKTFAMGLRDPAVELTVVSLSNNVSQPVQLALEALGVRVVNLGGATLKSVPRFIRLLHFLRSEHIDVTQTHLRYANILGIVASRLAGIPAIGTLHSAGADRAHYHPIRQVMETVTLRYVANRVVAVGPAVRSAHQDRLSGRSMDVFPNAVLAGEKLCTTARECLRAELVGSSERAICVAVGRLVPVKGLDDLLDAFAIVIRKYPTAALLIAGNGVLYKQLSARIDDLHLQDSVFMLGARQDIGRILAASDIFVNASHLEGLPVSLLEAMAAGLPSVATTVGDIPTVLNEETGILVPPHSPEDLAEAICVLLSDSNRRDALGHAARDYIADHHEAGEWARRLTELARGIAS
ncbi:MAG: glycosyltransferase [Thermomicrobiales bacterium]